MMEVFAYMTNIDDDHNLTTITNIISDTLFSLGLDEREEELINYVSKNLWELYYARNDIK